MTSCMITSHQMLAALKNHEGWALYTLTTARTGVTMRKANATVRAPDDEAPSPRGGGPCPPSPEPPRGHTGPRGRNQIPGVVPK